MSGHPKQAHTRPDRRVWLDGLSTENVDCVWARHATEKVAQGEAHGAKTAMEPLLSS